MKISINTGVAIIGLGYVGLPLAVEFGKRYPTVGFDINPQRVAELQNGVDATLEVSADELKSASRLIYSTDIEELRRATVYIVTVPTPVDEHKKPDLTPLQKASETVGKVIKNGDIVVYESTVYPGATEEYCVPVIEQVSGMKFNEDFFVGYSPERINPGDKEHRLTSITKVTSGSTPETADFVDALYGSVIQAGTHKAPSIKVAEAAKVIENTQRDLNIAFMNELSAIFHKLGIDTGDVLAAAATKWNFQAFQPGLVGGHCIGVDPYYLTHRAEKAGYRPEVILAGRHINDSMGAHIARECMTRLNGRAADKPLVTVLGLTFKENVPDTRNSKVIDIVRTLEQGGATVQLHDPLASAAQAREEYRVDLLPMEKLAPADAIIFAVAHEAYISGGWPLVQRLLKGGAGVVLDVKRRLDRDAKPEGIDLWRL